MGVHGLTTYLREHRNIARTVQFTTSYAKSTPIVVDGWSFIYEIVALNDQPWVYGGEYREFSAAIEEVIRAWLAVGLHLYFVFDGPFPELKFSTIISRANENVIKPSLLFFRTSAVSRSRPKFLRESSQLPPRTYIACIKTLQGLQHSLEGGDRLELHFADEEGDPYAVELAARLRGFVVGKDSDFVILNAEGYQGYIPLDEMIWSPLAEAAASAVTDEWAGEDGFQPVMNSKWRRKAAVLQKHGSSLPTGIIPPAGTSPDTLQLSVTAYLPADLAAYLEIPSSLLPLLASLVGNDFTRSRPDASSATTSQQPNIQWLFFERHLTLAQRIQRVALTLRNILNSALTPSGKKAKNREKERLTGVMDLIDRVVTVLLVRNLDTMASGEKEQIVERIVEATLQYAIPKYEGEDGRLWSSDVCFWHKAGECPLALLRSEVRPEPSLDSQSVSSASASLTEGEAVQDEVQSERERARHLYVSAYRSGYLDPHTLDVLHSGTFWHRQLLESPDLETVARVFSRPIQLWTYAIIDEVVRIPVRGEMDEGPEVEGSVDQAASEDSDDDELVDVVEDTDTEGEDPLAPLRGALQQLNDSALDLRHGASGDASATSQVKSNSAAKSRPRKIVEEYLRRGTRLAAEEVEVPSLAELLGNSRASTPRGDDDSLPVVLLPAKARLSILLRALGVEENTLPVMLNLLRGIPPELRIPALTLRWVVSRLHARARESGGNREREKEKWSKQEALAFLASFSFATAPSVSNDHEIPIVDRNVQLVAQVFATTDAIERLSEWLLLSSPGNTSAEFLLPSPALLFSGKTFHAYLTSTKPIPQDAARLSLCTAVCEGLDGAFAEQPDKKRKKEKERSTAPDNTVPVANRWRGARGKKTNQGDAGGKFGLLASLGTD
ncbi:PIN domain-like protein [Trametopsis cervina]|nr:PIN domain-like protein [Trametopsis cervina]